jgi:uncharacterized membrane protein YdjX (TVP38/TMEM64 family)
MKRIHHPQRVALLAILVIALAAVAWIHRDRIDRESIVAFAESLSLPWFVAALAVLPVIGFPITPLLVVAGIRFGFAGGMAVATAMVFLHNLIAFRVTHGWFRERLRGRLERAGYGIPEIPEGHQAWFTALFAAIHGPPYAAKLYLLALTNVPFRLYFWVGAPIYAFFCVVPVGAGSAVSTLNPWVIYALVGLSVALLAAGVVLRKRYAPGNR